MADSPKVLDLEARLNAALDRLAACEDKFRSLHGLSNPADANDPLNAAALNNRIHEVYNDIRGATG